MGDDDAGGMAESNRYRMLGALEVSGPRDSGAPDTPKTAAVLALLLCRANDVVPSSAIIEEIWAHNAPRSASTTTQTYVYLLRKLLRHAGLGGDESGPLETHGTGYLLRVEDGDLDATDFERHVQRGRGLVTQGRPREALQVLEHAMELWRGPALVDVPSGVAIQAHVAHLEEMRTQAQRLLIQAQFMLGRWRETIAELMGWARLRPLDEWVHHQLIEALSRAGRRADALRTFQRLRSNLSQQLGIPPSPALRRLELDVLNGSMPMEDVV